MEDKEVSGVLSGFFQLLTMVSIFLAIWVYHIQMILSAIFFGFWWVVFGILSRDDKLKQSRVDKNGN